MLDIKEIIKEKEQKNDAKIADKKNLGERHLIIGDMYERFKTSSFKKLNLATFGVFLSPYKTSDLYEIHSKCKQANNYAALFWHFVNIKK